MHFECDTRATATEEARKTIHILGAGAIGCYIACMLQSSPNSKNFKIHLLLRSEKHLQEFEKRLNKIKYRCKKQHGVSACEASSKKQTIDDDYHQATYSDFEASVVPDPASSNGSVPSADNSTIDYLIVATKAHEALKALIPVVSRLHSHSTLLLLHNGASVADMLFEKLWSPNVSKVTAPCIYVGVTIHAIHRSAPFEITHNAGLEQAESLWVGQFPTTTSAQNMAAMTAAGTQVGVCLSSNQESSSFLIDNVIQVAALQAVHLDWHGVRQRQLYKLVINASINAMSTLLGCDNSRVLNSHTLGVVEAACREFYEVFQDELPQDETWLSLKEKVIKAVMDTGRYRCSMLQDVLVGRTTEVDFINGSICRAGQSRGIATTTHQMLIHLVHAKETLYTD